MNGRYLATTGDPSGSLQDSSLLITNKGSLTQPARSMIIVAQIPCDRRMNRKDVSVHLSRLPLTSTVLVALATSVVPGPLAAQNPNGTPPEQVTFSFIVDAGSPSGSCAFPISVSGQGGAKTILLRSGNFIATSPNLNATVTNLANPTKQVNLNITGVFHVTTESDGTTAYVVTGRNLLTDPIAGVVLAIGSFSFAFDASGNLKQPLTKQGGNLIDICALLK
jgi:hypothetical protein